MATFQTVILIIAVILLIISLAFVGNSLKTSNSSAWPPPVPSCPDYWTIDGSGDDAVCINVHDLGTCAHGYNVDHLTMNFNDPKFSGDDGSCNKYTWATGCKISWDGLTYGGPNPCDASSSST
jgi:hypothetical protein